ncbi:DUF1003 domain-containing protein [Patescibacteria group bacterium]|nr:DUF1003 domain-containing protein [Patescibacteria group bacterium]MBU1890814.1 DUF1003 domain-containing protein [Patescibacteria group bacterium]
MSKGKYKKRFIFDTSLGEKVALEISGFFGSWWAILIHAVWFTAWLYFGWDIDLLTLIVSLEAIFLVVILLMYSNNLASRDDVRDEADLQADIRTEEQLIKVKRMIIDLRKDIKDIKRKK